MNKKEVRELLLSVGNNYKLVEELVSKKTRYERIEALINHRVVLSEAELPSKKEVDDTYRQQPVLSQDLESRLCGPKSAWAIIVAGGSYENQVA